MLRHRWKHDADPPIPPPTCADVRAQLGGSSQGVAAWRRGQRGGERRSGFLNSLFAPYRSTTRSNCEHNRQTIGPVQSNTQASLPLVARAPEKLEPHSTIQLASTRPSSPPVACDRDARGRTCYLPNNLRRAPSAGLRAAVSVAGWLRQGSGVGARG